MKDNIYYKTMIQQYEEIKNQKPHLDKAGIYCIKIDGVIIYIGKASNLLKRILIKQEWLLKPHTMMETKPLLKTTQ